MVSSYLSFHNQEAKDTLCPRTNSVTIHCHRKCAEQQMPICPNVTR